MGQNQAGASGLSYRDARDVVFLGLRDTVFCTECELISYNNSSRCLACGSLAVLNLSRVLGGSLRGQATARLVQREEIQSVVGEVLRAMKSPAPAPPAPLPIAALTAPPNEWQYAPLPHIGIPVPALQAGVTRSCELTGASGAAVAVSDGRRMVCGARAGHTAPDIGAVVPQEGLTALAVRSGRLWRCDDAEREPWADRNACRALGIRSIVIAPLALPNRVLGVLEVFSPAKSAFDDYHAAAVQLIASALAMAIVKGSSGNQCGEPLLPASEDIEPH